MSFYTYVLENKEGRYYIGYTAKNPEERAREHNQAKGTWTKHKGPWVLIHSEKFSTREEAFLREKQLKRFKGGRAFKELIGKEVDQTIT